MITDDDWEDDFGDCPLDGETLDRLVEEEILNTQAVQNVQQLQRPIHQHQHQQPETLRDELAALQTEIKTLQEVNKRAEDEKRRKDGEITIIRQKLSRLENESSFARQEANRKLKLAEDEKVESVKDMQATIVKLKDELMFKDQELCSARQQKQASYSRLTKLDDSRPVGSPSPSLTAPISDRPMLKAKSKKTGFPSMQSFGTNDANGNTAVFPHSVAHRASSASSVFPSSSSMTNNSIGYTSPVIEMNREVDVKSTGVMTDVDEYSTTIFGQTKGPAWNEIGKMDESVTLVQRIFNLPSTAFPNALVNTLTATESASSRTFLFSFQTDNDIYNALPIASKTQLKRLSANFFQTFSDAISNSGQLVLIPVVKILMSILSFCFNSNYLVPVPEILEILCIVISFDQDCRKYLISPTCASSDTDNRSSNGVHFLFRILGRRSNESTSTADTAHNGRSKNGLGNNVVSSNGPDIDQRQGDMALLVFNILKELLCDEGKNQGECFAILFQRPLLPEFLDFTRHPKLVVLEAVEALVLMAPDRELFHLCASHVLKKLAKLLSKTDCFRLRAAIIRFYSVAASVHADGVFALNNCPETLPHVAFALNDALKVYSLIMQEETEVLSFERDSVRKDISERRQTCLKFIQAANHLLQRLTAGRFDLDMALAKVPGARNAFHSALYETTKILKETDTDIAQPHIGQIT